ncbi:large ribosomal subunit protein mL38-like [Dysidea avara]|uniref:large ribosomal subunit protein mL38-like n=1 Tax=Dysidea avara TaxID=196820 RepID=UPI00332B5220
MQSGRLIGLLRWSKSIECRWLSTTSCLGSRSSAKLERLERKKILHENQASPALEELARTRKLLIPLDKVAEEYRSTRQYFMHIKTIGTQFGIFRDVFGTSFLPKVLATISYGSQHVYHGNIMEANKTVSQPNVKLPPHNDDNHLWTMIMTNPDGNLQDQTTELLHWMVTNISGTSLSDGVEVYPYLPPIPPQGSGYHRYVFAVYSHKEPLPSDLLPATENLLERRTFSTSRFLSDHDKVIPCGYNLFQTKWDSSVTNTYKNVMKWPEPVYKVEKPPLPHELRQDALRRKHNLYYKYLLL